MPSFGPHRTLSFRSSNGPNPSPHCNTHERYAKSSSPNGINEPRPGPGFRGPPGPIGAFVRHMIKMKQARKEANETRVKYQKMDDDKDWEIPREWRDNKGDKEFEEKGAEREREMLRVMEREKQERESRRVTILPSYGEVMRES